MILAEMSLAELYRWTEGNATPILLVADSPSVVLQATRALASVGLDDVVGYLEGGAGAWYSAGRPLGRIDQIHPRELAAELRSGGTRLIDVRGDGEWAGGHVEGALHLMAGFLRERLDEVPRHTRLAVTCGGGYRSAVAASVLAAEGFTDVANLTGGMSAWLEAGLPVVRDD